MVARRTSEMAEPYHYAMSLPPARPTVVRRRLAAVAMLAFAVAALPACNLHLSMQAEARDEITRSYPLAKGGTLEILNTNGKIQVDATDGATVEVIAERIVKAGTDQAAKDDLQKVEIKETITTDRVKLDSQTHITGINLFGGSRTVNYRVKVPRGTNVKLDTTNSDIVINGTSALNVSSTNGRIVARGVDGAVVAGTTNGEIDIDVARIADEGISCETTNGEIIVTVPASSKARVTASVTNGAITSDGLTLAVSEQSRRRLDATIGGGGPAIKLDTTNGAIRIRGR